MLLEENLQRARAQSNERMEAITLGALATLDIEEGRVDHGVVSMLRESHRLHRKVEDPRQSAFNVFRFAALLAARGEAEIATEVYSSAEALCEEVGVSLPAWDPVFIDEMLATIRAQLDAAAFDEARARGRKLTADEAVALALGSID